MQFNISTIIVIPFNNTLLKKKQNEESIYININHSGAVF
jgi:hypothetical protein